MTTDDQNDQEKESEEGMKKFHLLSADGLSAASVGSLAGLTGVHRNRIAEWRKLGAPAGLDLGAWAEWHLAQRHTRFADMLSQALAPSSTADLLPAAEGAPPEAEAAAGGQEGASMSYAERKERAQALRAEMELAIARREFVPTADAQAAVRRLAGLVLEAIAPGLWGEMLPALPGASPDLRARLRAAHDGAVLRLRDHIAREARSLAFYL